MSLSTRFLTEEDKEKIKLAVQLHTPIEVISYTLPREKEMYIYEVLQVFLTECHQEHMTDNLIFCLGELLTNSKKANTKRVFFKEHNLDINNEMDYHQGMISFKEDMLNNLEHYLKAQKQAGLYVKLLLQLNDEGIKIEIRNNSVLTIFEQKRINEKLRASKKYTDPKQVISRVIDQTEGAGLGIIIIVLMLQKIGLSQENYKVFSSDTETITQMFLPLNAQINAIMDNLYEKFVDALDTIPVFDNTLALYTQLAENERTPSSELIDFICRDVSLTSVILKEVSAKGHSCSKVSQAFNILGRDAVKELLSESNKGIRVISQDQDTRQLWKHGCDVAFYAYNLAQNYNSKNPEKPLDLETVYICGLLHDIECLLLEVATEEQKEIVRKLTKTIENGEQIYRLFVQDFGHSRGCYMIAQKWGLPQDAAQVIHYHNNPDLVPQEIKELVHTVYLADILQYYKQGKVEFYQVNETVCRWFNIQNKAELDFIVSKLEEAL